MAEPVEPSNTSSADAPLRAALERIAELEEQLCLAQRQAELNGGACDSWREAAENAARAHAAALTELALVKLGDA